RRCPGQRTQDLGDGQVWQAAVADVEAGPDENTPARTPGTLGGGRDEARLADAGLAGDDQEAGRSGLDRRPGGCDGGELAIAADGLHGAIMARRVPPIDTAGGDRPPDASVRSEQLAVRRGGRFAVARARFLAGGVGRLQRLAIAAHGTRLEDAQRLPGLALDRADPEWHPLRRVLEAVRLRVAAGVDVLEALRLDPHPLALEQAEHAGLARLRALVLAIGAGRLVVPLVRRRLLV